MQLIRKSMRFSLPARVAHSEYAIAACCRPCPNPTRLCLNNSPPKSVNSANLLSTSEVAATRATAKALWALRQSRCIHQEVIAALLASSLGLWLPCKAALAGAKPPAPFYCLAGANYKEAFARFAGALYLVWLGCDSTFHYTFKP
jgi:hypothetical protein